MTNKTATMSRELRDLLVDMTQNQHKKVAAFMPIIAEFLAAPVVERQEPALWVVSGGGVRPAPFMTYPAWAEGDYTITGYYASPPAPVAVALTEVRALLATTNYSASRDCHNAQVVGAACDLIDKVKELNQ